ncbi:EAL domain-containing protein [Leuconostoc gelidum]|uniref:EAL domain-containing protein n=1 Tax=Leuconostoc gelidum TaxID=1244 RepID=UPI001C7D811E|nr:EAL domain-containing protein [Leuconostoc gelidum]MBZ6010144.1 EAL domain-containing protein [Leuconostoc gelidum subsp. aenigmaticum]
MRNTLYFVTQSVVKIDREKNPKLCFHELLLREQNTGKFPGQPFFNYIATKSGNKEFFEFVGGELRNLLEADEKRTISINLEIVQLTFEETYYFFNSMKSSSNRVILELTERQYKGQSFASTVQFIRFARQLGYTILLDDVDNNNGINICNVLAREVDGVKISHRLINKMNVTEFSKILLDFKVDYGQYNLTTIVEGVSNQNLLEELCSIGINHQQGFYFNDL